MNSSTKKQLSAGVVLSYANIIVSLVTGLLYTPIVLRTLGESQYGVYSLCVSFISYLTILNAGVNAAYIRFYVQAKTKNEKSVKKLNMLFLKVFAVLAMISFVGGMLVSEYATAIFGDRITPSEYGIAQKCLDLLAVTVAIEVLNCLFTSFVTANERFIFGKTVNIIFSIARPIATLPFLFKGYDCSCILWIRLIIAILTFVTNFIYCRRVLHIGFERGRNEDGLFRNIAQFVFFIALQSIMDQLNWQIDKFILARVSGTTQISIYSVGATFNTYFLQIAGAMSGVFIAQVNRLTAKDDDEGINKLFEKTTRIFAYLTFVIIVAYTIFGKQFIRRWAGENYGQSFIVGWLLMAPLTFSLPLGLGQDIARAKNKHQLQIVINVLVCVGNLLISIPLAMKWEAFGSALGTFISEIIICLIVQPIYYKKVLGLHIKRVYLEIAKFIPGLIPAAIYGVVINQFDLISASYGSIAFYGVLLLVIYAISMWVLVMDISEKNMVRTAFKTIVVRLFRRH